MVYPDFEIGQLQSQGLKPVGLQLPYFIRIRKCYMEVKKHIDKTCVTCVT